MVKTVWSLISFLLFFSVFASPVFAQEWIIDSYVSDIELQENGGVSVVEKIDVDFGSIEKHGIYRDIPYVYEGEEGNVYTEVDVVSILQDRMPIDYELSKDSGYVRAKIGNKNITISGKHQYEIEYTVQGILRGFDQYDELYFNVVGPYWEVPIREASATVDIPDAKIISALCFSGYVGGTTECSKSTITSHSAIFESDDFLNPGNAFTIAVAYEKGVIPIITVDKPKTFFEKILEPSSLLLLASLSSLGVIAVFIMWYKKGRDFWQGELSSYGKKRKKPLGAHETIVVEYEPPEKLRPAEIGVIVDERAHTHDVTATIVDLAVRGYLSIHEVPKSWVFGKNDYMFKQKKNDYSELKEYESLLLSRLFQGREEVAVSELKMTFYTKLREVKSSLYSALVKDMFFPSNPEHVRNLYYGFGVGLIVVFSVIAFAIGVANDLVYIFDIGIAGAVSGIVFLMFAGSMSRRTAKGREMYRRIKGYRLFIETVEKHRQKFFEKKNMFNTILPYAIVFELTDKYIKAMDDMGIKPNVSSWYNSSTPFRFGHFASSMNDFSGVVSHSMASSPSSSGSSGGSSGGGFSGGGGGSW